eukprot:1322169-Alexandrium_andersonii.AAC.1
MCAWHVFGGGHANSLGATASQLVESRPHQRAEAQRYPERQASQALPAHHDIFAGRSSSGVGPGQTVWIGGWEPPPTQPQTR